MSALRDVLARAAAPGSALVGKFRCRVRVVGYEPADAKAFLCYSHKRRRVVCACHLLITDAPSVADGGGAAARVVACYEDFEELLGMRQARSHP